MTEYSVTVKSVRGACSGFALELLSDPYVITAYTGEKCFFFVSGLIKTKSIRRYICLLNFELIDHILTSYSSSC